MRNVSGPTVELPVGRKRRLAHPLSGDVGAVERTEVANHDQAVNFKGLAMLATDHGMGNGQRRFPAPADRAGHFERDLAFAGLPSDDDQFRLHDSVPFESPLGLNWGGRGRIDIMHTIMVDLTSQPQRLQ